MKYFVLVAENGWYRYTVCGPISWTFDLSSAVKFPSYTVALAEKQEGEIIKEVEL